MNGLHVLFPSVPYLHLKLHFIGRQLTEKPWDAMSNTMISFLSVHDRARFFSAIGSLVYLLVLLSDTPIQPRLK